MINSNSYADDLSLDEIFALDVSIATKTSRSTKEAPNIVSVLTKQDIKEAHARDLVDVINLIPGLNVAKDLDDPALVARGMYGFEGRTLIMVDGMQISDLRFGSFTMGDVIPVHLIERIEVIRGPGSVVYGGIAELAVVNIITSTGEQQKGKSIHVRYGQLTKKFGERNFGIKVGDSKNGFDHSFMAYWGQSMRSDGKFKNFDSPLDVDHDEDSAKVNNATVVAKFKHEQGTIGKVYYNIHKDNFLSSLSGTTAADRESARNHAEFEVMTFELSNEYKLGESWALTPAINYLRTHPWEQPRREDVEITRVKPSLTAMMQSEDFELVLGGEYYVDHARLLGDPAGSSTRGFRENRTDKISDTSSIYNAALYAGATWFLKPFTINLGLRMDDNQIFGNEFNPRLGFTYLDGDFHAKLLYSEAFRAPLNANNSDNIYGWEPSQSQRPNDVVPEKTKVVELEVGYQFSPRILGTFNIFDQKVNDVIEFKYDSTLFSANGGKMGTRGAELELKGIYDSYKGLINVSIFQLTDKGATTYIALHDSDKIMGAPELKIYTRHSFEFSDNFSAQFNVLYLSEKPAMVKQYASSSSDTAATGMVDAQTLFGVGAIYKTTEDLELILSVNDVSNERLLLVTPYIDGGNDDFEYKGREVTLSLNYKL